MYHRIVLRDECLSTLYGDWIDRTQIPELEAQVAGSDAFGTGVQNIKLALRLRHLIAGRFPPPLRFLDFGCGEGGAMRAAQVLGFDAHGIDLSDSRHEQTAPLGLTVHRDLEAFDAAGERAHAVVLNQVLEHLMDPLDVLRSLAKRMERGGVLMVAVPDCRGMVRPRDFEGFRKIQPLEHVNAFTPATLRAIGRRAGFVPIRRAGAFVTTQLSDALRSAAGMLWQPMTTVQYFRLR
jgi:SAM-dependent methyltransferase